MKLIENVWYKPQYRWLALLLTPLSWLFIRLAFRRKQKTQVLTKKSAVPVVVIGNITVGGTGKTPVVIALVRFLMQQGIRVGVISRGYKSQAEGRPTPTIVTDDTTALEVGDEPYLIYRETLCPLVVHRNRVAALETLLAHFQVDVVLSDDGLQHYHLARDIEIAIIDGRRKFGNGFCLPAGPLREPVSRLDEVDYILVNQDGTKLGRPHIRARVCNFYIKPEHLIKVDAKRAVLPLTFLQGLKCYAVAGIGHPERFFASLTALGAEVVPCVFADHHRFVAKDFAKLTQFPIVMTQKDAVKCEQLDLKNAYALEVVADLPEEFLRAFLHKLGYGGLRV